MVSAGTEWGARNLQHPVRPPQEEVAYVPPTFKYSSSLLAEVEKLLYNEHSLDSNLTQQSTLSHFKGSQGNFTQSCLQPQYFTLGYSGL